MNASTQPRMVGRGAQATLRLVVGAWRDLGPRHAAAASAVALLGLLLSAGYVLESNHPFLTPAAVGSWLWGVALVLAVTAADRIVDRGSAKVPVYAAAVVAAAFASSVASWHLVRLLGWPNWFEPDDPIDLQRTEMLFSSVNSMIFGGLGTAAYVHWRDARAATGRLRLGEVRRAQQARRVQETRLLALQARVDPEFLFAALKQVGALQRSDPVAADALLNEVIGLLRALMPGDEAAAPTVAQECALVVSYLRVVTMAIAAVTIEVAISAEAGSARLSPMLLLPLVKAALLAYGQGVPRLRLAADVDQDLLRIVVGTVAPKSGDPARADPAEMDALRERLAQLHDDRASLSIGSGPGFNATLRLPLEHDDRPDR